jgi:hypothetical protein
MYVNKIFFLMAIVIPLFLLMTGITLITPAIASSKSSKGGGSVTQEQVNSGDSQLDKEVNKFYSCISKTHQDPPTREKVDNCYYQNVGGSGTNGASPTSNSDTTGIGSSPTSTSTSTSHHHKK